LEREKETVTGASLRLWVAILLTIIALWFVDFLFKPRLTGAALRALAKSPETKARGANRAIPRPRR
jgi:hypothetical protein